MADVLVAGLPGIIAFDVDSLIDETLTNSCTFYNNDSGPSTALVQKSEKSSPFHESDSGLSEMSGFSGESPPWEMDMPSFGEMVDPFLAEIVGTNANDDYSSRDDDLMKYLESGVGSSEEIDPFVGTDGELNVSETGTATQTWLQTRSQTAVMKRELEHHSNQVTGDPSSSAGRSTVNNCVSRPTGQGSRCVNTNYERNASKRENSDSESDECVTDVAGSDLSKDVHRHKPKGSIKVKQAGVRLPSGKKSQLASDCNVTSVKVLRIVNSANDDNTEAAVIKALEEKSRKNAEMARQNRLKKKAYVGNLEHEVEDGRKRIDELESALNDVEEERDHFKREAEYLKSVLANQSALASLLKNIPNAKGVTLSSSVSRKRVAELDHNYTPIKKGRHTLHPSSRSPGVCLHVDNDSVSLEFCRHCADMASGEIS